MSLVGSWICSIPLASRSIATITCPCSSLMKNGRYREIPQKWLESQKAPRANAHRCIIYVWWLSAEAEALMVGSCTDKNRYYTHQSIAARLTHYFPSHRFEWFQPRSGSKGPSTITASDMYTRLDMWPSWKVGTNMGKFTPSAGDDWGFILSDSA